MTTTTLAVGIVLVFLLFTKPGRALAMLGVVIMGLTFGPEIWREEHRQPPVVTSMDSFRYRQICTPDAGASPAAECAAQRAKLCNPLGDKQKECERELDEALVPQH